MTLEEDDQKFSVIIDGKILVLTAGSIQLFSVICPKSLREGRCTALFDFSERSVAYLMASS